MAHPYPKLPLTAVPRSEIEVSGQRVITDADGNDIAYVGFDEDAEYLVRAANAYLVLVEAHVALRSSTPNQARQGEPVKRHVDALRAVVDALNATGVTL